MEKEMIKEENTRKKLFLFSVLICFITIFIYEMLTPMLMDDLSYGKEVQSAGNFFELFSQEHNQYMTWTGRSVAHIMLRICMFIDMHTFGGRVFFNLISSAVFTVLTLLIYLNADTNIHYNVKNYILSVLLIWLTGISFGQTVLWETGACNYLFTTTIVMTMITLYRRAYRSSISGVMDVGKNAGVRCVGFFLLGVVSGWCNENTSGGLFLMMLILIAYYKKVFTWTISAAIGTALGLGIMVLAPGNKIRVQYMEESNTGILALAARFLKITLTLKEEFMVMLIVLTVIFIFLKVQGRNFEALKEMILFTFIFFATAYSLILTVTPQVRAYFGAGIFLTVAIVQGYACINTGSRGEDSHVILKTLKLGTVAALLIYMAFSYIENGANLARIYRDETRRFDYLESKAEEGAEDVEIPMLHEQFDNRYSAAFECDVTEDWQNWNNQMIANYYGFKTVSGIDPDAFDED
ncbi:DUF3329 domain-containing protein [Butyrivibrio sp. AE3004]|uniref:DUF3329 domain-containing protein n=1 Tax=Butyrivibrio sp. AE3004 TaxID=1506994 RepID=UPI0018CC6E42|nr:DUF6056 family protein [Butyrivibrio sp. AE3004]